MVDQLKIAAFQFNPTVGGVAENTAKILHAHAQGKKAGVDLVVTSEHSVLGYSPEDLVKKPDVISECWEAYQYIAEATKDGPSMVVGGPLVEDGVLYNVALYIEGGEIKQVIKKHDLPNYGVFDDKRLFGSGLMQETIKVKGTCIGIMICEDTWFPEVAQNLKEKGAEVLISINGSPYEYGKETTTRMDVLQARVTETGLPILYVNQVGGQDGVVYDGHSLALNSDTSLAWKAPGWTEHVGLIDCRKNTAGWSLSGPQASWGQGLEQLYSALVLGTRDYIYKNNFKRVVIGISGGADSALVAAIAADAIGPENVIGVRLPSKYTSDDSMDDATELAQKIGFDLPTLPIEEIVKVYGSVLTNYFKAPLKDLTAQNLQPRARAVLLMGITNQLRGCLLLTTGNKSEMAVGYATLYGDMSGGFNPLKDVYKTDVFKLMEWRNAHKPALGLAPSGLIIPPNIIRKPPSAELKSGQTDESELGSYDKLDALLKELIEKETPITDILAQGFDKDYVRKISDLLDGAEFKRRQAAPGIKTTSRALFGDRRYPITNGFRASRRVTKSFSERVQAVLQP